MPQAVIPRHTPKPSSRGIPRSRHPEERSDEGSRTIEVGIPRCARNDPEIRPVVQSNYPATWMDDATKQLHSISDPNPLVMQWVQALKYMIDSGCDVSLTLAPKITVEDALVDWTAPALRVDRLVRGCTPAPGAWTRFHGERLKLGPALAAIGNAVAHALGARIRDLPFTRERIARTLLA